MGNCCTRIKKKSDKNSHNKESSELQKENSVLNKFILTIDI